MERLFVDTSAWFAFINRQDPDHDRVRVALRRFEGRLVTSNFVFDEVVTLCRYRLGHRAAIQVGATLLDAGVVDHVRIEAGDEQTAWELFNQRADKQYSYTDCTSFALMRRLALDQVAALDDDFVQEGFIVLPAPSQ